MRVNWRRSAGTHNSRVVLAAALDQAGFSLEECDGPADHVTCYSLNQVNMPSLLREIASADCITVAGGPSASACWAEVSREADYVVVGEGERTLVRLLTAIEEGRDDPVPGTATFARGLVPTDSTVLLDAYPAYARGRGYIECTRGCPQSCAFCQTPRLFPGGMRHRSLDACLEASRRLGDIRFVTPNAFAYGSDGRTPRFEKVRRLLTRLSRPDARIWFGTFPSEVRPEFVTDEALELVTEFCENRRLHFGIQSGSDRVLGRLGRGHTVADGLLAVERTLDNGLVPVVDLILGFPFETNEEQAETLSLAVDLAGRGCHLHVHGFVPLPGTPLAALVPRPPIPAARRVIGRLTLAGKATGSLDLLG
ncbi:tRNA-2-methylthio-N(6)-dimethylallyladenosine synthase [anaerobic digester metagenome]